MSDGKIVDVNVNINPAPDVGDMSDADVENIVRRLLGYNPFSHLVDEIKKALNSLGDEIKSGIESLGNQIKGQLTSLAKQLEGQLNSLYSQLSGELQSDYTKLSGELQTEYDKVKDEVETEVKTVVEDILKAIESGALTKALNIIKLVAPTTFVVQIGPVSVDFDDIQSRISDFEKYASNPPSSHDEIIQFIKDLAPGSVSVTAGVQAAALLVTSSDLSLQFTATFSVKDFIDAADDIFNLLA